MQVQLKEEPWQVVDNKMQVHLAALQRCFPEVPADMAQSVLAAHENVLQVAKQVCLGV